MTLDKPNFNKLYADRQPASQISKKLLKALYRYICNMGMVNGIATIALYDAYTKLQETKAYKQQVKKLVNAAVKSIETYESTLKLFHQDVKLDERYSIRDMDLFDINGIAKKGVTREDLFNWYLDVGSLCYSRNRRQTDNLRNAIMQVFTRHQLQHRDALTQLVFADTVLCYSLDIFDHMIDFYQKEDNINYYPVFKAFALEQTYELVHEAACSLGKQIKQDDLFTLARDAGVETAMTAYNNAVMYDFVSATSVDEALEANKDIMTKSRYRSYKERYNASIMERNGKLNNEYTQW